MGLFSRKKNGDGPKASKKKGAVQQTDIDVAPPKPRWDDAWMRTTVDPEEVQELIRGCTIELKSRALDMPFLLLPFRPTSDPSAARTFIRHFFDRGQLYGEVLAQELRLTEPMVICSVIKWCWSRLPGGVVGEEAYLTFAAAETDSFMARESFATFIPISVESDARTMIIFDFFDLISAIAAHSKSNGFGGRKLSRLAGWWAFEHNDGGNGFEGGYRGWARAADQASHLFFAYLRSLAPESVVGLNGISNLPMSLQKLVQETEYPPEKPSLLQSRTTKVAMIVDSVSPTPFALLRRANHFQYRDDDRALQEFSEFEDPIQALTDECRRVLKSISSANQSGQASSSTESTGLRDASWSRFEDMGFSSGGMEEVEENDESNFMRKRQPRQLGGLRSTPHPRNAGLARPTTPSWADFLNVGFVDEKQNGPAPLLLPPDKILPPINTRGHSSQSAAPRLEANANLEPGELASINVFDLDDSFWWVWICSLAGEETPDRKAAFGRCAVIETIIRSGRWLVIEEIIKGAAPEVEETAYIVEKKSFWGRSKKTKKARRQSLEQQGSTLRPPLRTAQTDGVSKTSIGPDQHARIQAAAIQLQQRQRYMEEEQSRAVRRGRKDLDMMSQKTSSVFTLQPVIRSEASPAMKWANKYDKDAIREAYLKNANHGRGLAQATMKRDDSTSGDTLRAARHAYQEPTNERDLPAPPQSAEGPAVPSKSDTPPPASFPPTPRGYDEDNAHVPEQAFETPLPVENNHNGSSEIPSPIPSPMPPMKQSMDIHRSSVDQGSSPESKTHNKLKKKEVGGGGNGGFRKMFGRKKEMPPSASQKFQDSNDGGATLTPPAAAGGGGLGRRLSNLRKKPVGAPVSVPSQPSPISQQQISEDEITPVATPHHQHEFERSYDPSLQESLSRVDTGDAQEAQHAFSSFDQGPLEDVPAFVPEDSPRASFDDAAPPPISMSRASNDEPDLTNQVAPPQDRWAQIRKNAAERAAARHSEEQSRGGYSQKTDGDDGETSGEETIESRVARIKARVAELTGNMESNDSPTSRSPVQSPFSAKH